MGSRNGLLGLVSATALACALLAAPASATDVCPGDEDQPTMQSAARAIGALVCDINVVRANNRLPALRWDWRLWWVAQQRAEAMARTQTFAHLPDLGGAAARAGYVLQGGDSALFENLGWARGTESTPLALTLGWLRSETHRVNVLDRRIRDIGIGMAEGAPARDAPSGIFYVAEFGNTGTAEEAQASPRPRARRSVCSSARRPRGGPALRKWRAHRARCRTARFALPR